MTTPWYADGLKFHCTQCGDCCTGAPGYVWVNQEEIEAIAAAIGEQDLEKFREQYVRSVGVRKSLKERENGDCVFFDSKLRKCQVYHERDRVSQAMGTGSRRCGQAERRVARRALHQSTGA